MMLPKMRYASIAISVAITTASIYVAAAPENSPYLRTKCSLLFAGPDHSLPNSDDPLSGFNFAGIPQEASLQAHKLVPATLVFFNHLPRNEQEYKNIYGKDQIITTEINKEIDSASRFNQKKETTLENPDKSFSNLIEIQLKKKKESIIVFIGHNNNGSFVFRDGSKSRIESLVDSCAKAGKICIFISCHSKKYINPDQTSTGVLHAPNFAEALQISEKIHQHITEAKSKNKKVSVNELSSHLETIDISTHHLRITYIVLKVCGGAASAIGIAILIQSLDCDAQHQCTLPPAIAA